MASETSAPAAPQDLRRRVVAPAAAEHVPAITALVNEHARRGDLLPRSQAAIAASLEDWLVGLEGDAVVACGSLFHYNGSLAEVRSVAVSDGAKGRGWGSALVKALLTLAEERQVPEVFTLTRAVGFFAQLGFVVTDKEHYPLKVWKDCQICPLQDNCDETAMALPGTAGRPSMNRGLDREPGGRSSTGGTHE